MKKTIKTPEQFQISLLKDLVEIESAFSETIDMSYEINSAMSEYKETSNEMVRLESFMSNLEKTKLQPSVISHIAGVEGLDQLIGVDLSKVTSDNRNQMTNVAVESIGDNIGKISDWLITRIKKIIEEGKKFVIRMRKIWERVLYSIEKIETFLANDIKELSFDETVFSAKKIKCYSYADTKSLINNVNGAIHMGIKMFPVAEKGALAFQTNFFHGLGIKTTEVNTFGPKSYLKLEPDRKNKIKRQAAQVHQHGWTSKLVFGYIKPMKELVLNIKNFLEEKGKALNRSQSESAGSWILGTKNHDTSVLTKEEKKEYKINKNMWWANYGSLFELSTAICKVGKELTTDYIKLFNGIKFHKKVFKS